MDVALIAGLAAAGAVAGDLLDVAGGRLALASAVAAAREEEAERSGGDTDGDAAHEAGGSETVGPPPGSQGVGGAGGATAGEAVPAGGAGLPVPGEPGGPPSDVEGGGAALQEVVPVFSPPFRRCPSCGAARGGVGVVPVLGPVLDVLARRRCGSCRSAAPLRPVVATVLTALLCATVAARFGDSAAVVPYAVLFAFLVSLTATDLTTRLVPKRLVYTAVVLVGALLAVVSIDHHRLGSLESAAVGGVATFACFFVLWWFVPKGIGFGDVRLSGLLGMALGWFGLRYVYVGLVAGFAAGAVIGIVLMGVAGLSRKSRIPFVPFLAFGTVVGVLWGGTLISWWPHPGG